MTARKAKKAQIHPRKIDFSPLTLLGNSRDSLPGIMSLNLGFRTVEDCGEEIA